MTTTAPPSEDPRLQRCGFAKLVGTSDDRPFVTFVTKYDLVLGRSSKSCTVDVVLGTFT